MRFDCPESNSIGLYFIPQHTCKDNKPTLVVSADNVVMLDLERVLYRCAIASIAQEIDCNGDDLIRKTGVTLYCTSLISSVLPSSQESTLALIYTLSSGRLVRWRSSVSW